MIKLLLGILLVFSLTLSHAGRSVRTIRTYYSFIQAYRDTWVSGYVQFDKVVKITVVQYEGNPSTVILHTNLPLKVFRLKSKIKEQINIDLSKTETYLFSELSELSFNFEKNDTALYSISINDGMKTAIFFILQEQYL